MTVTVLGRVYSSLGFSSTQAPVSLARNEERSGTLWQSWSTIEIQGSHGKHVGEMCRYHSTNFRNTNVGIVLYYDEGNKRRIISTSIKTFQEHFENTQAGQTIGVLRVHVFQ